MVFHLLVMWNSHPNKKVTVTLTVTVITCRSWLSCPGSGRGGCRSTEEEAEADSVAEGSRQPGISGSRCSPGPPPGISPLCHGGGAAVTIRQSSAQTESCWSYPGRRRWWTSSVLVISGVFRSVRARTLVVPRPFPPPVLRSSPAPPSHDSAPPSERSRLTGPALSSVLPGGLLGLPQDRSEVHCPVLREQSSNLKYFRGFT